MSCFVTIHPLWTLEKQLKEWKSPESLHTQWSLGVLNPTVFCRWFHYDHIYQEISGTITHRMWCDTTNCGFWLVAWFSSLGVNPVIPRHQKCGKAVAWRVLAHFLSCESSSELLLCMMQPAIPMTHSFVLVPVFQQWHDKYYSGLHFFTALLNKKHHGEA